MLFRSDTIKIQVPANPRVITGNDLVNTHKMGGQFKTPINGCTGFTMAVTHNSNFIEVSVLNYSVKDDEKKSSANRPSKRDAKRPSKFILPSDDSDISSDLSDDVDISSDNLSDDLSN